MPTTPKPRKSKRPPALENGGGGAFRARSVAPRRNARAARRPNVPAGDASADGEPEEAPSEDVLEFLKAVDDYKRRNARLFPSFSEILSILRSLGYRKE